MDYKIRKQSLDAIYKSKARGIKIRSKCSWYELGEKATKFSLNLEKHHSIQSQTHSVINNQDKNTNQAEINKQKLSFYQFLFSRKVQNQTEKIEGYLENIPLPKLTDEQALSSKDISDVFKVKHVSL